MLLLLVSSSSVPFLRLLTPDLGLVRQDGPVVCDCISGRAVAPGATRKLPFPPLSCRTLLTSDLVFARQGCCQPIGPIEPLLPPSFPPIASSPLPPIASSPLPPIASPPLPLNRALISERASLKGKGNGNGNKGNGNSQFLFLSLAVRGRLC